eukprot:scaffold1248_cov393-Prasinococcus_capsulatus_cf.AAC.25
MVNQTTHDNNDIMIINMVTLIMIRCRGSRHGNTVAAPVVTPVRTCPLSTCMQTNATDAQPPFGPPGWRITRLSSCEDRRSVPALAYSTTVEGGTRPHSSEGGCSGKGGLTVRAMEGSAAATVSKSVEVELGALFDGEQCEVATQYGSITVSVVGDRSLPACITLPDLALGHQACFQKFFLCAGEHSLLLRNFCFYHVVSTGYDDKTRRALTLVQMEEQVALVVQHFSLEKPTAIGAGTGGHILLRYAQKHNLRGLILISPLCSGTKLMERLTNYALIFTLRRYGWTNWSIDQVLQRFFSNAGRGVISYTDLALGMRRELRAIEPLRIASHLVSPAWCVCAQCCSVQNLIACSSVQEAAQNREDLIARLSEVKAGRILLVVGEFSPYKQESLDLNEKLDKRISSWIEVRQAIVAPSGTEREKFLTADLRRDCSSKYRLTRAGP